MAECVSIRMMSLSLAMIETSNAALETMLIDNSMWLGV